jgi:hypothetical protein
LPESWTRFCSLIRALPKESLPKNELLDIFYNGLTDESLYALQLVVALLFPTECCCGYSRVEVASVWVLGQA